MYKVISNSLRKSFSSQKYFLDTKFRNLSLTSHDKLGTFSRICHIFEQEKVNLSYVRTHFENKMKGRPATYRIEVSYQYEENKDLQRLFMKLNLAGVYAKEESPILVPWFPRKIVDLDLVGQTLLQVNQSKDHEQFKDEQYRKRRDFIADVALTYKMGNRIPDIDYSEEQTSLWRKIYDKLHKLHQYSMATRFIKESQQLRKQLLVDKRIPQLSQLNDYLQNRTGFSIKPTHGILSQRQFLNCFAFKVFCCTQYLRNVKNPDYTPQPDIVHEIVGHIPLFADKHVAELSQKIGLLSLGASDEEIAHLGSLYWYTLEFGVCKEANKMLGYGAGIASSIGQIQNMLGTEAKFKKFEPAIDRTEPYPVQTVQPLYRYTESFEESLKDLSTYGRTIMKPVTTVYNENFRQINYDRHVEGVYTEDKGPKF